jgi:hypothetical protein
MGAVGRDYNRKSGVSGEFCGCNQSVTEPKGNGQESAIVLSRNAARGSTQSPERYQQNEGYYEIDQFSQLVAG